METLEDLKLKVLEGEEVSPEDYAKVVDSLRSQRTAGSTKKKAAVAAAAAALPEDLNDLFK